MNKKTILSISITLGVITIIMFFSITLSLIINKRNKDLLNKDIYVVIYQYEVIDFNIDTSNKPIELYRALFTNELKYEKTVYTSDGNYNVINIENGIIKVTSSTCSDHLCEKFIISKENFINNTDIVCMPNGLVITLEVE